MLSWTSQKRLVVAGSMGSQVGCSMEIADDFGTEDEWRAVMDNVIDAAPETPTVDAYAQGWQDYGAGLLNPPSHLTPDHSTYLRGWNDAWAEANGRVLLR